MGIPKAYTNDNQQCFGYTSAIKRWPAILDGVINDLQDEIAELEDGSKKTEGGEILEAFKELKSHVVHNSPIQRLHESHDSGIYNEALEQAASELGTELSWHNAPWLLSECFLYRNCQAILDQSANWKKYDFFERTKNGTFGKSADAVSTLATRYHKLSEQGLGSKEVREVVFHELVQSSLWGNATDLSLLVTVSLEELKKLQVAADQRDKETLLINDLAKAWKALNRVEGGRVDIVLDNSGFELYTDLILSLFLLESGLAEQVVLHPKSQPWFVSDVTPRDWGVSLVKLLRDEKVFPKDRSDIDYVVEKLLLYSHEGAIVARQSPFWTSPLPFWEIKKGGKGGGDALWQDMRHSKLVIFKGDLNYRKVTGDVMWPRTTPFQEAIQSLATSGLKIMTLRTIKADVLVGLPEGKEQELDSKWKKEHPDQLPGAWAWSGAYAVVNYFDSSSAN